MARPSNWRVCQTAALRWWARSAGYQSGDSSPHSIEDPVGGALHVECGVATPLWYAAERLNMEKDAREGVLLAMSRVRQ